MPHDPEDTATRAHGHSVPSPLWKHLSPQPRLCALKGASCALHPSVSSPLTPLPEVSSLLAPLGSPPCPFTSSSWPAGPGSWSTLHPGSEKQSPSKSRSHQEEPKHQPSIICSNVVLSLPSWSPHEPPDCTSLASWAPAALIIPTAPTFTSSPALLQP